jgi:hypothetical protein
MSDISDHSGMMDFEEDDDRQIAPTRRGLPADTGSLEDWEDDSVMFGEVLNTIKKVCLWFSLVLVFVHLDLAFAKAWAS